MTSGVRSSVCQLDDHTYCTFCMCDFECMKYYLKNKKGWFLQSYVVETTKYKISSDRELMQSEP